jgi:hypothetical protein
MANEAGGLPAVANAFAPDVLADDALGFEHINGTVRITFGVVKMIDPAPPSNVQMVAIGRLVMGVEGAQRLAIGLFDYLKNHGLDRPSDAASDEKKPH